MSKWHLIHGAIHGAERVNEKPTRFAEQSRRRHFQPSLGMGGGCEGHAVPVLPQGRVAP